MISGIYKVFYLDKHGKEYIVQFTQENWWMSDYQAFLKQQPSEDYIECLEEGEVICLTLQSREKLAADLHTMETLASFVKVSNFGKA